MVLWLRSLFRARPADDAARRLYAGLVAQARRPEFYGRLGVPDTPLGRFSMLALHGFLVMERLAREPAFAATGQAVLDTMITDMDRSVREMGVGDLSVGRKVKGLVRHFYGLAEACREGLRQGDDVLAVVLSRNLYGAATPDPDALRQLVAYVRASAAALERQPAGELVAGMPAFAELAGEREDVGTG